MADEQLGVLAEAIRELTDFCLEGASPDTVLLDVSDGTKRVSVPVLACAVGGELRTHALLDEMVAAADWARRQRLLDEPGPDRREGTAKLQSLESFIAHANRFRAVNSAVWADAAGRKLVAVLDYHFEGTGRPRWGRHRGEYSCPLSEAWVAWGGERGLQLDQDAFAQLLDARDRELTGGLLPNGREAPSPAALVSLATNLEVYSTATAKRERDPATGRVRINFTEDKGVSGSVQPPPAFLIHIPIFQDGEHVPLEVRLRVEVRDGAAVFLARIHAAGAELSAAFLRLCERVKTETSCPVFVGIPE